MRLSFTIVNYGKIFQKMKQLLIDSHCHLNYQGIRERLDSVIENATNSGVAIMQTIATKMSDIDEIKNIANRYENVYYSVGVHPLYVCDEKIVTSEELIKLANSDKKVSGFGETGLDYYKASDETIIEMQKESFINHIAAAQIAKLPVIIHTRDAEYDTYDILRDMMRKAHFSGVIHCFTGSMDLARNAIELGLYISASGIITFKNADSVREVFSAIPIDRILIETDAPFLAPVPYRGKVNEPCYIVEVAKYLAEIRNMEVSDIIRITTDNFLKLFTRVKFQQ